MLSEESADDSVCGPRDCVLGVAGVSGQVRINPLHLFRSFDVALLLRFFGREGKDRYILYSSNNHHRYLHYFRVDEGERITR